MKHRIEKKKELPPARGRKLCKPGNSRYPWIKMERGDCFRAGPYSKKAMTNMLTLASHSWPAVHLGWDFQTRKVDDDLYVWRVV